jgi:DNA-binding NarL/FixJ family response regulator
VRDALARAIARADPVATIVEAADFASTLRLIAEHSPDLVLIDLNMPGMAGVAGVRDLRGRHPTLRLLVASGQEDPPTIRAALAAGANGFFPKSAAPEWLMQAIAIVMAGSSYVPPHALADCHDGGPPALPSVAGLTARQLDVMQCLLKGLPNKSIARELGLVEGTVKMHIAAILRALHARNRTEAVVRARELGLREGR